MKYNTFKKYFSEPRLHKFVNHNNGNLKKALLLYRSNLILSQAFYPILSVLEISLRNAIDKQLNNYFSDSNWLIKQKTGFMNDSLLNINPIPFYMKNNVNRVQSKLNSSATHDKILSQLTFGFWTEFFHPKYYKILHGQPIHIFSNLPKHIKRNNIYNKLNSIRVFRNRIYHYEPICFINSTFDVKHLKNIYSEIIELIQWFDNDLFEWVSKIDTTAIELEKITLLNIDNKFFSFLALLRLKTKKIVRNFKPFFKKEIID